MVHVMFTSCLEAWREFFLFEFANLPFYVAKVGYFRESSAKEPAKEEVHFGPASLANI